MIRVEGLTKTYRVPKRATGVKAALKALVHRETVKVEAIRDVSFHVSPGEMVGYIGPNGAGKSTTIKIMSGILVPDSGSCVILGRTPWKERIAHVRDIGVVFGQRSQLWWDVPVQDSFELLRDIYRVPEPAFKKTSDRLTEVLGLSDLLKTPVRSLSLGQRMRCELAASLLHSPKILFLDEPTIGLDAVSKLAVRQFIREINREEGTTVILTTHDMNDIEALTNRILLIGKGHILYDGGLDNLRGLYDTVRTVTVDFREGQIPPDMEGVGMERLASGRARYRVDTDAVPVSSVVSRLSASLDLQDVTIGAQPVEELIVRLYREHQI
jgi:ABC-2 type transport system ATP-binding protein